MVLAPIVLTHAVDLNLIDTSRHDFAKGTPGTNTSFNQSDGDVELKFNTPNYTDNFLNGVYSDPSVFMTSQGGLVLKRSFNNTFNYDSLSNPAILSTCGGSCSVWHSFVDPDTNFMYVAGNAGVSVVDLTNNTLVVDFTIDNTSHTFPAFLGGGNARHSFIDSRDPSHRLLYVSTDGGVSVIDILTGSAVDLLSASFVVNYPFDSNQSYLDTSNNLLYIVSAGGGLIVINTLTQNVVGTYNTSSSPAYLSDDYLRSFAIDPVRDLIYVGTWNGVSVIDRKGTPSDLSDDVLVTVLNTTTPAIGGNNILDLNLDNTNRLLYVSTYDGGLSVVNTIGNSLLKTYNTVSDPEIMPTDSVYKSFFGTSPNLLFIATNGGVSVIDRRDTPKDFSDDLFTAQYIQGSLTDAFLTPTNLLYLGTGGGGVTVLDIDGTYVSSADFTSQNIIDADGNSKVNIAWTSTVPTNTSLELLYSVNGGVDFTSLGTTAGSYDLPDGVVISGLLYKAVFVTNDPTATSSLNSVTISYGNAPLSKYISDTGVYTSGVLSAVSDQGGWDTLVPSSTLPSGTDITYRTRSGNTELVDGSWSAWEVPTGNPLKIISPFSKYIQYEATLTTGDQNISPVLHSVVISYQDLGTTQDLTNIEISGSPLYYSFAHGTYSYTGVIIQRGVTSITVTPIGAGVITVDGTEVASGNASQSINLISSIPKTVTVVATETGKPSKTYTIEVLLSPVAIGDSYQGGKIAYIDRTGFSGFLTGIIALDYHPWGCIGTPISGADGVSIGSGYQNTLDIIAGCAESDTAAKVARAYQEGGYTDWYLPSKDELNQLYLNKAAIGILDSDYYWSSTKYDNTYAWDEDIGSGFQETYDRDLTDNVRVIRNFAVPRSSLTNLVLSGSPSNYTFASGIYTYNGVTVANNIDSVTITPTGVGSITVDGGVVLTDQASGPITLDIGVQKTISVIVSESEKIPTTYSLYITRLATVPDSQIIQTTLDDFAKGDQGDLTNIYQSPGDIELKYFTSDYTETTRKDFRAEYLLNDRGSTSTYNADDENNVNGNVQINKGYIYSTSTNPSIANNRVIHSFLDSSDNLLYVSTDFGLSIINTNGTTIPSDDTFVMTYNKRSTPAILGNFVRHSFLDKTNPAHVLLYISTDVGLVVVDTKNTPLDQTDDVVIATYNPTNYPGSVPNKNMYHSMLVSDQIYLSTYGGGLTVINRNGTPLDPSDDTFSTYSTTSTPALVGDFVRNSFLDPATHYLYVSSFDDYKALPNDGGVTVIDTKGTQSILDDTLVKTYLTNTVPSIGRNSVVNTYLNSSNNLIYVSTQGGGLSVIDPTDNNFALTYSTSSNPAILSNNVSRSYLNTSNNYLYIATDQGISVIDTKGTKVSSDDTLVATYNTNPPSALPSLQVTDLFVDTSKNLLYSSTWEGLGVIYLDGKYNTIATYQSRNIYSENDLWTPKQNMTTARFASVTGVINGIIYVAGGAYQDAPNHYHYLNTLEAYDPIANTWTTKTSLPGNRAYASGGVINGKLYITGGWDGGGAYLNSLVIYDPVNNTWDSSKSAMPVPRRSYAAGGVVNNKLYVVGGRNESGNPISIVKEYDPTSDTWTDKTSLPDVRQNSSAATINGKLYIAGGQDLISETNSLLEYDPIGDSWAEKTPMPYQLGRATSAVITTNSTYTPNDNVSSEKLFIIGGKNLSGEPTEYMLEYNPITNKWKSSAHLDSSKTAPFDLKRRIHSSAAVVGSDVYIIGGGEDNYDGIKESGDVSKLSSVELSDRYQMEKYAIVSWTSTTPVGTSVELQYSLDFGQTYFSLGNVANKFYYLPSNSIYGFKYKAILRTNNTNITPSLDSVTVSTQEQFTSLYGGTPGEYTSTVLSAGATGGIWKTLVPQSTNPSGTNDVYQTRTGNTPTVDGTWSAWQNTTPEIPSPKSKYIQYKAILTTSNIDETPTIHEIAINYQKVQVNKVSITDINSISNIPESDSITYNLNTKTAVVKGNASSNSTVHFTKASVDSTALTNSQGKYEITLNLSTGNNTFIYYLVDDLGNISGERTLTLNVSDQVSSKTVILKKINSNLSGSSESSSSESSSSVESNSSESSNSSQSSYSSSSRSSSKSSSKSSGSILDGISSNPVMLFVICCPLLIILLIIILVIMLRRRKRDQNY